MKNMSNKKDENSFKKCVKLFCIKCETELTKRMTLIENILNYDNNIFYLKQYHFKTIFHCEKTKLKNKGLASYLYNYVKCAACSHKIGRYVTSATDESWYMLDYISLQKENFIM